MNFLRSRLRSFGFAFAGLRSLVSTQPNARIHLAATLLVVVVASPLNLSRLEWALLCLAIGMVWMAEALNTSLEFLADELTLEQRPRLKIAKDVAAFGVLAAAIAAAAIGMLVLVPHLVGAIELRNH